MPSINFESTRFGSITISDKVYPHDVYLLPDQEIVKRDKSHSKRIRGHKELSLWELKKLLKNNPRYLVIGTGQTGILPLTQESESWLTSKLEEENIALIRDRTPLVLDKTNELLKQGERVAGIFHTTC
ncbi:MAG: MTH938/NDUFAF3 family protein [Candidatus Hodarchaeota archaeon]